MKKIGLIGCGNWGSNILRDLIELNCTVYIADTDKNSRIRALEKGADKAFAALENLPPCDGYVVAVPIPDLTPVCTALLDYKKPIFSEKTLCMSLEDYHLLNNLGGSDYIFVMHKWHYHPGIEALRVVAHSGKIGVIEEIFALRHAWSHDFHGGDVFWTQVIHDLTIVKHILGAIPETIESVKVIENESGLPTGCTVILGHRPWIVICTSGRHCNKISGVSIQGSKGTVSLRDAYEDHVVIKNKSGEEKMAIDTTFPLYLELEEFIEYLEGGPAPRCSLQHAREVTEIILKIREKGGLKS